MNIVIPTIGRKSIIHSVESILREGLKAIVVSDGIDMNYDIFNDPNVKYVKLGFNYGKTELCTYYGQIAITTGFYLSNSEFTGLLGDDDELVPGSGEIIRELLEERPEIDIWIPELIFNDGGRVCSGDRPFQPGNISHPIYRTKIFSEIPMHHIKNQEYRYHDFYHVERCKNAGYTVDWIWPGKPLILIRPRLQGRGGYGSEDVEFRNDFYF